MHSPMAPSKLDPWQQRRLLGKQSCLSSAPRQGRSRLASALCEEPCYSGSRQPHERGNMLLGDIQRACPELLSVPMGG